MKKTEQPPRDGTGLIQTGPWLAPYADRLRERFAHYLYLKSRTEETGGLLGEVSQGHHYFGVNRGERDDRPGVWYREWAPGAKYLSLIGDFNSWDRGANPLERDEWGVWSAFLPDDDYRDRLVHGSRIKVHVGSADGGMDRIPAYARRVIQEEGTPHFVGQFWDPPEAYRWTKALPVRNGGPRV